MTSKSDGDKILAEDLWVAIVTDMKTVLSSPAEFFKNMPKEGGFAAPLIFMVAMSVLAGVVMALLSLLGIGQGGMMSIGFMGIIMFPLMTAIFGFVGAAVMFVIWKIMGSKENYETAYRCVAYSHAYVPVGAVLHIIPYIGTLIGAMWPMALLALSSIHVHGRRQQISWTVFGLFALIMVFSSFGAEKAARRSRNIGADWQQQSSSRLQRDGQEMSPEEAGKMMGDFLQGMQRAQEKQQTD